MNKKMILIIVEKKWVEILYKIQRNPHNFELYFRYISYHLFTFFAGLCILSLSSFFYLE